MRLALVLALLVVVGQPAVEAAPRARTKSRATKKGARKNGVHRPARPRTNLKTTKGSRSLTMAEKVKFSRVSKFGKKVDSLRADVKSSLGSPKPDLGTARAAIVRLMDKGYLRIGSERYANRSDKPTFGASSLRKEHVRVRGNDVTVSFVGKSGVKWSKTIRDGELASAIKVFMALPGERLFQYRGKSGKLVAVTSRQMRPYLKEYGALPKDFRTLHANRIFKAELAKLGKPESKAEAERNIKKAVRKAARALNHEPDTSEAAYLHPKHAEAYRKLAPGGPRGPP